MNIYIIKILMLSFTNIVMSGEPCNQAPLQIRLPLFSTNKRQQLTSCLWCPVKSYRYPVDYMMTSSNGNIFRVTGLLCAEFTGHRWIFPHKRLVTQSINVLFGHYDVIIMRKEARWWKTALLHVYVGILAYSSHFLHCCEQDQYIYIYIYKLISCILNWVRVLRI